MDLFDEKTERNDGIAGKTTLHIGDFDGIDSRDVSPEIFVFIRSIDDGIEPKSFDTIESTDENENVGSEIVSFVKQRNCRSASLFNRRIFSSTRDNSTKSIRFLEEKRRIAFLSSSIEKLFTVTI